MDWNLLERLANWLLDIAVLAVAIIALLGILNAPQL